MFFLFVGNPGLARLYAGRLRRVDPLLAQAARAEFVPLAQWTSR